jgi:hypothetical protein
MKNVTTQTLQLPPGKQITIELDFNKGEGKGVFPTQDTELTYDGQKYGTEDRPIVLGFIVTNNDVGKLEPRSGTDKAAVIYKHEKPGDNKLVFFAVTGERAIVNVINIPIHDHSSIVQGGPAFGSYYSAIKNNE